MRAFRVTAAVCMALLPLIGLPAQVPVPGPRTAPVDRPATDLPKNAIPLLPPGETLAVPATDTWATVNGGPRLRNVTQASLMPFLPPRGRANGTAVIVAPGGGFAHLAIDKEGFDVARSLAAHGVAAFVLKYRLRPNASAGGGGTYPPALDDAKAAIRLLRQQPARFGIDPARVGFMGFSAGAFLAQDLGVDADPVLRPDFLVSVYGPMAARPLPATAPPLFIAVAADDTSQPPRDFGLYQSWRTANRPVEMHVFERGGHGFGVPGVAGTTTTGMMDELYLWLDSRGLLGRGAKPN